MILECEHTTPAVLDDDLIPTRLNHELLNQIRGSAIREILFTSGLCKNAAFKLFYSDILRRPITSVIRNEKQVVLEPALFGHPVRLQILYYPSGTTNTGWFGIDYIENEGKNSVTCLPLSKCLRWTIIEIYFNELIVNPFYNVSKFAYICLMFERFQKYKGIHPGVIIDRELKKRNLSQRSFAISLPEHPQSFNAIIKGKRKLNTGLALKIEHALGLEEGALLMLQMYYDINEEKRNEASGYHPDFSILRKNLFWDTDIHSIEWEKYANAVIRRVFERGNTSEKEEIIRFYGLEKVKAVMGNDVLIN